MMGDTMSKPTVKASTLASPFCPKFGIRLGGEKRGKRVTGQTVPEYLKSINLDLIVCGPSGGECGKGGRYETTSTGVRSYHGGERISFSITTY